MTSRKQGEEMKVWLTDRKKYLTIPIQPQSHWQGLGLDSVAFGWSRCLSFISAVQIAQAKRYSTHFIVCLHCLFLEIFLLILTAECYFWGGVWEKIIYFLLADFFPPARVQIFWVTHLLQGRKWPRKQNEHKKSAMWGMKKGRESSENKALSWEGWKGLDADAYLRKMISGCFPTAPNASFSFLSLVSL